jgi:hypothetical protein
MTRNVLHIGIPKTYRAITSIKATPGPIFQGPPCKNMKGVVSTSSNPVERPRGVIHSTEKKPSSKALKPPRKIHISLRCSFND